MHQGTRRAVSVALISFCLWGCSQEGSPALNSAAFYPLEQLDADAAVADSQNDAGEEPPLVDAGAPPVNCATSDSTCDGVDDDCDGEVDEDFRVRCVFSVISVVCVDGVVTTEFCRDSDPCTTDSCGATGCKYKPISCDDGIACTTDSCDPELGCSNSPAPGAACDDGDACTSGESCDAAGSCQPGAPVDFDDHNPCTADACDPAHGVSHEPVPGVTCDDGDACSLDSVCDAAGSCQAGAPIPVDDGNPCTADVCDPVLGVSHVVVPGAACDDGNPCSQADACTAEGTCAGVPLPGLDDGNACTTDTCDPLTGGIEHAPLPVGASCSDGNDCNGPEVCMGVSELTVPVSSLQTFLRADHLDYYFTPPTIVRLSDHGFGPGRRVRISTIGAYAVPNVTQAFLVFSRDERLLDRAQPHRVPGAVQSEAPAVVTGITPFDAWTTDIPEDFVADAAGIELTIPQGAHYLFLGFGDTWYADNSGSLQLVIQALPGCVAGQPPAAGLSCVLADGAAGACDGVCDCVACTAEPALCE